MAIEYTAATAAGAASPITVIFSPPFFAAMPRLAHRAAASAAPNGIETQSDAANDSEKRQGSIPGVPHPMCARTSVSQEWRRRGDRLAQLRAVRGSKHAGPLEGTGAHLDGHHAKET
jgi:hypothetical protein